MGPRAGAGYCVKGPIGLTPDADMESLITWSENMLSRGREVTLKEESGRELRGGPERDGAALSELASEGHPLGEGLGLDKYFC